jgi:hypothetical protein
VCRPCEVETPGPDGTREAETPGAPATPWWGQAPDSDEDDAVGGGMGNADAPPPFSAARTAKGKLAADGMVRCAVCQGQFERHQMVLLSHCNHPFCAPCMEAGPANCHALPHVTPCHLPAVNSCQLSLTVS